MDDVTQTTRRLQHSRDGTGTLSKKKEGGVKVMLHACNIHTRLCTDRWRTCNWLWQPSWPLDWVHPRCVLSAACGPQVRCIADINRAGSQAFRGGGAMCFMNNEPLWEAFNAVITEEEACGTGKDEGDDDDDDNDELKN